MQYAEKVARSFVNKKPAKSPLSDIGGNFGSNWKGTGWISERRKSRRLTTDGVTIKSYEWWTIAMHDGENVVWVTTDQYNPSGQYFKNGNPKNSVVTKGHINEVKQALGSAGYAPTGITSILWNEEGRQRVYEKWTK